MFPWLAAIARRFESYHFKKLKIWYLTESATDFTGSGYAALVVDYDSSDSVPSSKMQALSFESTVRGSPWEEFCHISTSSNLSKFKQLFVRNSALSTNLDIKTYDVGNLYFVSGGGNGGQGKGELWVEYDIELFTPQFQLDDGLAGGAIASGGSVTPTNPLGLAPSIDPQAIGMTVDTFSNVTILQAGTYQWSCFVVGTSLTSINLTVTSGSATTSLIATVVNTGANTAVRYGSITIGIGPVIFYISASAATVTQCGMLFSRAPAASLN